MTFRSPIPTTLHSATATKALYWIIAIIVVGTRIWKTVNPSTDLLPELSKITVGILMLVVMGAMITVSPALRVNRTLGLFCIVGMISLLFSGLYANISGYEHLAVFILMLGILSPLVSSAELMECRKRMWRMLMFCLRAIVTVSFGIYLADVASDDSNLIFFKGCTGHAMSLGIISAVVLIDTCWQLLIGRSLHRIEWIGYGLLLAMGVIDVVVCGSRCAIMSAVCGLGIVLWNVRHQRLKLIWAAILVGAFAIVLVTTQFMSFESIAVKNNFSSEHGSITFTRDYLWNARLNEFAKSPLVGIGFSMTTEQDPGSSYDIDDTDLVFDTREPGSSWLNVLSSTGILGFLLLLIFNLRIYNRLRNVMHNNKGVLYMALLVALWVHGFFEGWVLFAGSTTFMIYWLLCSQIVSIESATSDFDRL